MEVMRPFSICHKVSESLIKRKSKIGKVYISSHSAHPFSLLEGWGLKLQPNFQKEGGFTGPQFLKYLMTNVFQCHI